MSKIEVNEYVLCIGCQNSYHMDKCQPLLTSGEGKVYCPDCYSIRKSVIDQIKGFAFFFNKCFSDLGVNVAFVDKYTNEIIEIIKK